MKRKRIVALCLFTLMLCSSSAQAFASDSAPENENVLLGPDESEIYNADLETETVPYGWNGATDADYNKENATPVQGDESPDNAGIELYATATGTWVQSSNGKWWFRYSDGTYPANCWKQISGKWYHFDASGWMQTGWLKDKGYWYYLGSNGVMVTGWLNYNGKKYYLSSSGAMVTGWQQINIPWYYFDSSGAMVTGWLKDNGNWYYLYTGGAMATGWVTVDGQKYYLRSSGAMVTGWYSVNGTWYYFKPSGAMASNGESSSLSAVYDGRLMAGFNEFGHYPFDIHVTYTEYYTHNSGSNTFTSHQVYYTVQTSNHKVPARFTYVGVSHSNGNGSSKLYMLTRSIPTAYEGDLWRFGNVANDERVSYGPTSNYTGTFGFGIDGTEDINNIVFPVSTSVSISFK